MGRRFQIATDTDYALLRHPHPSALSQSAPGPYPAGQPYRTWNPPMPNYYAVPPSADPSGYYVPHQFVHPYMRVYPAPSYVGPGRFGRKDATLMGGSANRHPTHPPTHPPRQHLMPPAPHTVTPGLAPFVQRVPWNSYDDWTTAPGMISDDDADLIFGDDFDLVGDDGWDDDYGDDLDDDLIGVLPPGGSWDSPAGRRSIRRQKRAQRKQERQRRRSGVWEPDGGLSTLGDDYDDGDDYGDEFWLGAEEEKIKRKLRPFKALSKLFTRKEGGGKSQAEDMADQIAKIQRTLGRRQVVAPPAPVPPPALVAAPFPWKTAALTTAGGVALLAVGIVVGRKLFA